METKVCTKCKRELPATVENFYPQRKGLHSLTAWCKECFQAYRSVHAEEKNQKSKNRKLLILSHYGGQCAICGIDDLAFLNIDHINNDSCNHRNDDKHLYDWLIRNDFPSGFQVLCWNHNWLKFLEDRRVKNDKSAEKYTKSNDKIKGYVIDHYGGKCACCGENNLGLLTIDHTNGGGNQHRLMTGCGLGVRFYRWLRDNEFPLDFRVLCFNCNDGRRVNNGVCPHELRRVYDKRLYQVSDLVTSRVPSFNSGYTRGYPQTDHREQHKILEQQQCLQVGYDGELCSSNQEGSTKCPVQDGRGLKRWSTLKSLNSVEVFIEDNTEPDRENNSCDNGVTTTFSEAIPGATATNQQLLVEEIV